MKHIGNKLFQCDICQKRFTQKSSLNTHKRTHSDQQVYSCEICCKKFSVKSYLDSHKLVHVGKEGITCNLCQMTFRNRSQYTRHMRTHTSSGFNCEDCYKVFPKSSSLLRHRTRVHKYEDNQVPFYRRLQ